MQDSREADASTPRILGLLPWTVLGLAATFACRRLDNTDTWWHLASGRWIAEHGAVQTADPFSFTVRGVEWINLQWTFDLFLYGLFRLGGANALVGLSVVVHTAAVALVILAVRRWLGPLGTTALVGWVVFVAQPRFAIRPEMFSFLLMLVVLRLLEDARAGRDRRLFLLVPVMVLWANLHSLYVLGLFFMGCALAVALVSRFLPPAGGEPAGVSLARRRLLTACALAGAATLINPYFLRGATFPLTLLSRFDRTSIYRSISEFRSPFSAMWPNGSLGAFQIGFVVCVAVVLLALVLTWLSGKNSQSRKHFSPAGLMIFAGLAGLALVARRNVAIFALGAAPFVGACLSVVGSRIPWPPASLRRRARFGLAVVLLGAVALGVWATAGNHYYRRDGKSHETGLGLLESRFPIRAADFFHRLGLPGPHYNDLSAGGYLSWARPTPDGVFIDGRLEVYNGFFGEYLDGLADPAAWSRQVESFGLQSAILFHHHRNRHRLIHRLSADPEWALVYFDEVAVVFVRTRGNEPAIARAIAAYRAERPEIERRLMETPEGWAHPLGHVRALVHFARILDLLGQRDAAVRFFERSLDLGLHPREAFTHCLWLAGYYGNRGDRDRARAYLERAESVYPGQPQVRAALERLQGFAR